MDRVSDYESAGWEFESLHPHHEISHANSVAYFVFKEEEIRTRKSTSTKSLHY